MNASISFLLIVLVSAGLNPPVLPWFPIAPSLPPPAGQVIRVSTVDALFEAAETVQPGGTILIEDGQYYMPRYFEIHTNNVTLRSASGQREKVILDGEKSMHGELVGITSCSGVMIADLTIQNIKWNGFKINSDKNVQNLTIYNCVIHNIWQRGVKSVKIPEANREEIRPKNCRVQYCLFYNDRPKQYSDDPSDTEQTFRGNYIGGIDTMFAKGWTISDNVFTGIHGRTGEARGCVFMWHHAENCVIERNVILDCDTGVALGNSSGIGPGESSVHGTNMIVRNNFLSLVPENGIIADYTQDCKILNNTIYDPKSAMQRLIRVVHTNPGLLVANNLLCGPDIRVESDSAIRFLNNRSGDYAAYFVDPTKGNLHLADSAMNALDKGISLPEVTEDIDRQPRQDPSDIGADEKSNNSGIDVRERLNK